MTALVGILNKHGAVIAADSAVTVTKGDKIRIYNTATKIFPLSDRYPIAAMIFESSDFMTTPWDVIFKLYKERRGDRQQDTVRDYAEDFLDFLHDEDYFTNEDGQDDWFCMELAQYYQKVRQGTVEEFKERTANLKEGSYDEDELFKQCVKYCIGRISHIVEEGGVLPTFKKLSYSSFLEYHEDWLKDLNEQFDEDGMPHGLDEDWQQGFYKYLCSKLFLLGTGIVLVGYGSKEIYPALLPVYLAGVIGNRLRGYIDYDEITEVGKNYSSSICPFAQTDVMNTLMRGINPSLQEKVLSENEQAVAAAKERIIELLQSEGVEKSVIEKVKTMPSDEICDKFSKDLKDEIQSEFLDGIVDSVDSFNLEDMANMAESFISMTNLQRHISSSDETVGGPIDVAVLTCSGGFEWVKHKKFPADGR